MDRPIVRCERNISMPWWYEEREEILQILDLYLDMAEEKRNEEPPADELE